MSPDTLSPRLRKASDIREGDEIQHADGTWLPVTLHRHITYPLKFVRIYFADGREVHCSPDNELMSRRTSTKDGAS